mgnify:CR=1 FL=1
MNITELSDLELNRAIGEALTDPRRLALVLRPYWQD